MKTYVTGGSGRLGREVLRLVDAIPLNRSEKGMPREIVTDFSAEDLKKRLADADALIHLAGSMRFWRPWELWEANYGITKRLVEAVPERCNFIFASSISVYGKKLAKIPANEQTPLNPDTEYAKSKADAEKEVLRLPNSCMLRIGTIYGPEFHDYYRIFSLLERGRMPIIGDGKNRVPFVHVEEVAKAVKSAVGKKGTYAVCGNSLTQEEIFHIACKALHVPPPKRHIPVSLALFLAQVEEYRASLMRSPPSITKEYVRILSSDRAFDYSKAWNELGFFPRPLAKGIKEMAEHYLGKKKHK